MTTRKHIASHMVEYAVVRKDDLEPLGSVGCLVDEDIPIVGMFRFKGAETKFKQTLNLLSTQQRSSSSDHQKNMRAFLPQLHEISESKRRYWYRMSE